MISFKSAFLQQLLNIAQPTIATIRRASAKWTSGFRETGEKWA
jgi:hypothetical protein